MEKTASNNKIAILIVILLLLVGISGCISDSGDNGDNNKEPDNGKKLELNELTKKVEAMTNNSLTWVETLDINPIKLRKEMGIKGKKKFVELLDIYFGLYQTTFNTTKKDEYTKKVEELANVTKEKEYHDLNDINDTQFRQDSTSYLRAWYILNEIGLNTTYYVEEIEKVLIRLNNHLPSRGTNQKMAFVFYYNQLGYDIDYTTEELFNVSVIRSRIVPENLSELKVYHITHEIFFLFAENKMSLLSEEDNEYIQEVLKYQVNFTISNNNVDLLAELIMIMHYLDFLNLDLYNVALNYLLSSQNANGSFGDYEDARKYYAKIESKIDVDILLYLHTTEVSIRALNEAVYFKHIKLSG
jgi:hypothetical protein